MTFVTSIIFVAIISSAAAAAGRADLLFDADGWQIEATPDLRWYDESTLSFYSRLARESCVHIPRLKSRVLRDEE